MNESRLKIMEVQEKTIKHLNTNAIKKIYQPGEKVFVLKSKCLGNKFHKLYVEKIIERDLGTTVLIDGKVIHKSNLC